MCASAHALSEIRGQSARERVAAFGEGLERIRGQMRAGRSLGHVVLEAAMLPGGLVEHYELRRDTARPRRSGSTPSACSKTCARCAAPPRRSRNSTAPPRR